MTALHAAEHLAPSGRAASAASAVGRESDWEVAAMQVALEGDGTMMMDARAAAVQLEQWVGAGP